MPTLNQIAERERRPRRWESADDCVGYIESQMTMLREKRDTMDLLSISKQAKVEHVRALYDRFLLQLGATLNAIACAYAARYIDDAKFDAMRAETLEIATIKTTAMSPEQIAKINAVRGRT